MVCYGLVDLTYKRAAIAGVAPHQMLMSQALFFAPGMYLYGYATNTLVFDLAFRWGLAAGAAIWVAMYYFNRSLATGAVSIMAPIFRLSFVITALLAIAILGEAITTWKLGGFAFALVALRLLVVQYAQSGTGRLRMTTSAVAHVTLATIAMGLVSFFYKLGAAAGGTPATVLAGQATVFAPLAVIFGLTRDRGWRVPSVTFPHAATTALLLFVGAGALVEGLSRGDASTLVPIAQLSFVVSATLGIGMLGEPFTRRKVAGLACAVAALTCLAIA